MSNYLIESSIVSMFFIICGVFIWHFYHNQKYSHVLFTIILLGCVLRVYANMDQYLHQWDERYHALVASNLLKHPLKPTLIENPVLTYDPNAWCCSHIWLHKPLLPLLLIAGSISIFGLTEWAVRFPSLILSLFAIWATYQIAKILFDKPIALIAAFLHSINGQIIELGAGRISSDHVETCHIVMFQAGIYFSLININRPQYTTSAIAGFFTGLAFMSKWTPSSMIPMIWLVGMIINRQNLFAILKHAAMLTTCAVLVATPWLWYIHNNFPFESNLLFYGIFKASTNVVEGHGGPWYYYLNKIRIVFGELIYLPIIMAIYVFFRQVKWGGIAMLLVWITIPLLIFSCAATKRDTYMLVSAPAFFILTSWFIITLVKQRYKRIENKILYNIFIFFLFLLPVRFCAERLKIFMHYERKPDWMLEVNYCRKINFENPNKSVLFGVEHNIETMFYTGMTAYPNIPNIIEMNNLKTKGYDVFIQRNGTIQKY